MNLFAKTVFAVATLALPAVALADDPPAGSAVDPNAGMPMPPPNGGDGQNPAVAPMPPNEPAPATKSGKGASTIGGDLAFVLPLGDYADGTNFALGAFGRFEFGVSNELDVTIRLGYLWHKTDTDGLSLGMIPILVGGSFKIGGGGFVYGEAGFNNVRVSFDSGGLSGSDSETYLSLGAGGGYAAGKVKARVGLWMPGRPKDSNDGHTTLYGVLASVGFDFASL